MKGVKEEDLANALDILRFTQNKLDMDSDLKKLEQAFKKRWHPDFAIGLGLDPEEVNRRTKIFQKIPTCIEIFRQYLKEGIQEHRIREGKKKTQNPKSNHCGNENLFKRLNRLKKSGKSYPAEIVAAIAFTKATRNNNKRLAEDLLAWGVDIEGDSREFTPLSWAVKENNIEMVNFLLQRGASPNTEIDRRSTLFWAIEHGNLEITELLLKSGADPERILNGELSSLRIYHRNRSGWTLLMHFISSAKLTMIELLVEYGANVSARTGTGPVPGQGSGWTPLMIAVQHERLDIADFLLRKGADIDKSTLHGLTAYRLAIQTGNEQLIQLIQAHSEESEEFEGRF